jgi:hypothetical protein
MKRYKIVKVMRKTARRYTQETGLTISEAQRYIENDKKENPSVLRSMLIFTEQ